MFPRQIYSPKSIFKRFFSHIHLTGKRLLVQIHQRTAKDQLLGKVILQIHTEHCLALHSIIFIAFKAGTDTGTRINDTLINDSNTPHGIIHRVIYIFG